MNSRAGKTQTHEKDLFKVLKKRAGESPTVNTFFEELGKVEQRVRQPDTYLNQEAGTLVEVISPPIEEGRQMSSDSRVDSLGNIPTTDRGATSSTDIDVGTDSAVLEVKADIKPLSKLLSTSNMTSSVADALKERKSEVKGKTNVKVNRR